MRTLLMVAALALLQACSLRHAAIDGIGNALAQGGGVFASDEDPELVQGAAPFSLKLVEGLLAERPRHPGLLLAAVRGFTQYAYAFVQQPAEELEGHDLAQALRLQQRAAALYRRARDYGMRGLALTPGDVALLYWTGAAWAGFIGLSKDSPEALAELPKAKALLQQALERDPAFGEGVLHVLMMSLEPDRAREHFARADALSGGRHAAPLVALAETACIAEQRRAEFEALLQLALRIDTRQPTAERLTNLIAQRRARWLLARTDHLFSD